MQHAQILCVGMIEMEIITESAEHHFLTTLEECKSRKREWIYIHYAFGYQLQYERLINKIDQVEEIIEQAHAKSLSFLHEMEKGLNEFETGYAYHFSDSDLIFLIHAPEDHDKNEARYFFNSFAEKIPEKIRFYGSLENDMLRFQKIADNKLLSAKRIEVLHQLSDTNKIDSIPLRRKRRQDPMVMIVEDDRFTSAYTTSILNKTFDICHAKTGEEAIPMYIEHAPDIVLLDIHLPGMDGHSTLKLLRRLDPEGFMVMLSVDASSDNVLGATEAGAQTFLKKPFSKDRLVSVIRKSPHIRMHDARMRDAARL